MALVQFLAWELLYATGVAKKKKKKKKKTPNKKPPKKKNKHTHTTLNIGKKISGCSIKVALDIYRLKVIKNLLSMHSFSESF